MTRLSEMSLNFAPQVRVPEGGIFEFLNAVGLSLVSSSLRFVQWVYWIYHLLFLKELGKACTTSMILSPQFQQLPWAEIKTG
jgi:hypothetical protein